MQTVENNAPATPPAEATSPSAPAKGSAVATALAEARAKLAAGQSLGTGLSSSGGSSDAGAAGKAAAQEPAKEPAKEAAKPAEAAAADPATATAPDEGIEAPADLEGGEETPAGETGAEGADVDAAPAELVIPLKGRREGDPEIELVAPDKETADRIRQLQNDGMRKQKFLQEMKSIDNARAELREVETMMQADPAGFVFEHIPEQARVELARMLVVHHFDAIQEDLERWLGDEAARAVRGAEYDRDRVRRSDDARKKVDAQRKANAAVAQIRDLVPDGIEDDVAESFVLDAIGDIEREAARRGGRVPLTEIPQIVARRVKMYGFGQAAPPTAPAKKDPPAAPATPPKTADATPQGDAARLAEQKRQAAEAAKKRIKLAVNARAKGTAVAPAGAGALPSSPPKPPAGAKPKDLINHFRKHGLGWGNPT